MINSRQGQNQLVIFARRNGIELVVMTASHGDCQTQKGLTNGRRRYLPVRPDASWSRIQVDNGHDGVIVRRHQEADGTSRVDLVASHNVARQLQAEQIRRTRHVSIECVNHPVAQYGQALGRGKSRSNPFAFAKHELHPARCRAQRSP